MSLHDVVVWSYDLAGTELRFSPGMDALLGLAGATDEYVRDRVSSLLTPLTQAAHTAPVWDDLELDEWYERDDGDRRLLRFRARKYASGTEGGLVGVATDITRTAEDQQSLRDLADRYRLLVELSPDAICVHQDGVVVYVNPATVRMGGLASSSQIIGRPITDFVAAESLDEMYERLASLTAPGTASEPAQARIGTREGDMLLVEAVSVRTSWEGRPAYQVIMRDITAQKEAEAALHNRAALVQHVSNAVIATTAEGVVTSWNPAAETIYGRTADAVVGEPISRVVGAELDPARVLQHGVTDAVHRHADGSALTIRVSVASMDSGFVLVCADETARRRAEQHYATVITALNDGVVVVDPRGVIATANPAAARILGTTQAELTGSRAGSWTFHDEQGAPVEGDPVTWTQRSGSQRNSLVLSTRRPDGTEVWLAMATRALDHGGSAPYAVLVSFTDVTESRAIRAQLERAATQDPLTTLANRTEILKFITESVHGDSAAATTGVLFVDLDKFKVINDSLGHAVGDEVLRVIGQRFLRQARPRDVVGRLGGDEFVVITRDDPTPEALVEIADRLRADLTQPIALQHRQLRVDASVGVVLVHRRDPRLAEDILRDADVAMYQAKVLGGRRCAIFDVDLRRRMQRQLDLEQELRGAADAGLLHAVYQPIIDIPTGEIVAVEALLRWNHPEFGKVSPAEFIPIAEESGLINDIGARALRTVSREFMEHLPTSGWRLNVNLSARQLDDAHLPDIVRDAVSSSGLPASRLCLEITESALMQDLHNAGDVLAKLREPGVSLAIDDFGTGYSSLAQLHRMPTDSLKIDRSFVLDIGKTTDTDIIVSSIIAMAHTLNLAVVAEGVETEEQLTMLRDLGCDQAQGFLLGKPVPIDALEGEIARCRQQRYADGH
ncbi:sensor domain-containing protein [Allosaccharopolyspora coralli]|uniref:sensor domain-containing protein n=1 Tax=Allosaccharopolyspora coralli TaxID=2665642 RepID=UPI001E5D912C|nr:EAL domain-containing protein [Allosaccharopolyspora coralli]